ncbi:hypothetical protein BY996DRAFT_7992442 [Phakopsora pachyrhizi]|nr:hypothetical protein BY996DRAFT_7992442 [Phakopsora pachyrhizi]
MKLLAFIGDFFTPMLPLLLFFYSSLLYSLLLCLAPLPQPLYPVPSALLSFYPLCCHYPVLIL